MSEIRIALAGNPNSGKTTMFNDLTGWNSTTLSASDWREPHANA